MDTNDDFYGKELNLNCFYMHTNFEQKYPEMVTVVFKVIEIEKILVKYSGAQIFDLYI